jgi:predicted RNase H-like HicB family nuclease
MRRFLIVIEKAGSNYSAYAPDLPGCVATGKTIAEVKRRMREAIQWHLQGLAENDLPIPQAHAVAEYIAVTTPSPQATKSRRLCSS